MTTPPEQNPFPEQNSLPAVNLLSDPLPAPLSLHPPHLRREDSLNPDSLTPESLLPEPPPPEPLTPEQVVSTLHSYFPYEMSESAFPEDALGPHEARPLFHSWTDPDFLPPPPRTPNLGHLLLLAFLALIGLLGSTLVVRSALYFHLFGISTPQKAAADVHYTIGSMAALYLITFAFALLLFPLLWHKSLFAGLHWNAGAAMRRFRVLIGAACVCFVLAMLDEVVLPGPANAPIDKLFESRTAAWLLFAFGVTFAPFFEETVFRGFLLPALCTAFDWSVEQITHTSAPPLDPHGNPQWSFGAMVFASVSTSVPFALMHAEQTAWSLGPFLLLVCVSLVLCWARLATRSLAASVVVHASYNFLLFSLMLLGTQGFRHMDKM